MAARVRGCSRGCAAGSRSPHEEVRGKAVGFSHPHGSLQRAASRCGHATLSRTDPRGTPAQSAGAAPLRLSPQSFDLIAEVKRRSPAAGNLAGKALRITEQARSYARGGAAALSVLTEPEAFDGDLSHLQEVAAAVAAPCMRKDFLVSPYQVLEARAAGASGVLLIAAMLNDAQLQDMLRYAHRLGLFALVEIFDAADLERSVSAIRVAGPRSSMGAAVRCSA